MKQKGLSFEEKEKDGQERENQEGQNKRERTTKA